MELDQGFADVLAEALTRKRAEIRRSSDQRPFTMQKIVIPLDTAATEGNPYRIHFPFSAVFVRDATDSLTNVYLAAHADDIQQIQNSIQLKINDAFSFQQAIGGAFLTWAAQSGKSITLYFFLDAQMKSGSQLSLNAGGLSINDGSAFTVAPVVILATTPKQIFSASASRKVGTFENETGADIWIGGATVSNTGATKGLRVPAGGAVKWRNTAALYAYSVAGGTITAMEES